MTYMADSYSGLDNFYEPKLSDIGKTFKFIGVEMSAENRLGNLLLHLISL